MRDVLERLGKSLHVRGGYCEGTREKDYTKLIILNKVKKVKKSECPLIKLWILLQNGFKIRKVTFFKTRADAGRQLAKRLSEYQNALVLALPRGGVPVAFEIAQALGAPLLSISQRLPRSVQPQRPILRLSPTFLTHVAHRLRQCPPDSR